jgi:long-chain acyl-CoA synthetase
MNTVSIDARKTTAKRPQLYETDASRYAGPHKWQINPVAKLVRRLWRRRTYTRWVDEAVTELTVTGREHLERLDEPCIFIANHQSHLDTLVAFEVVPEHIKRKLFFGAAQDRWFIKGRKKMVLQPWYQSLALGNFPIMRGGGSKALEYAGWLLHRKQCVFVFPEGTRATSAELGEFRHGVALLALRHGVPVVPLYLSGLRALRPKGAKAVVPGPAGVDVLPPMRFAPDTDVADATHQLWAAMSAVHRRHNGEIDALNRAA